MCLRPYTFPIPSWGRGRDLRTWPMGRAWLGRGEGEDVVGIIYLVGRGQGGGGAGGLVGEVVTHLPGWGERHTGGKGRCEWDRGRASLLTCSSLPT